jgi:putative hydrolase of the HAD superfamily
MYHFKVIAFDADDTLWDCQSHFEAVEQQLYDLITPYCDDPARELYQTESANMADLGYGCKAFTISIIETALRVGGNSISHGQLDDLLHASKQLLHLPATPLPGVEETLAVLREQAPLPFKMVCFTKGELQDQENKLRRSGLEKYFDDVMITSNKTQHEFRALCRRHDIHPSELLMVGNSLKSDIAPALAIGAWAIHIPFHVTWQLEKTEDFDHERMMTAKQFSDIPKLIGLSSAIHSL